MIESLWRAALLATVASSTASAQCVGEWVPAPPAYGATSLALKSWDPDGPGPSPALLISGGIPFNPNDSLGAWNGQTWSQLGAGPGPNNWVYSLTLDGNNHLVIGGIFDNVDGIDASGIARWDGSSWHALGSGLRFEAWPAVGIAHALATLPNGDIVAGGWWFDTAGGIPVQGVARWDGAAWNPMGNGLSQNYPAYGNQANIWSLSATSKGLVAVGGITFSGPTDLVGVALWNGSTWTPPPLSSPFANIWVPDGYAMTAAELPDGRLVVGTATGVYYWTGLAWVPLGEPLIGTKWAMLVLPNGDLVVGGEQLRHGMSSNTIEFGPVARWDGTAWLKMTVNNNTHAGRGYALTMFNGDLVVAGQFSLGTGGIPSPNLAVWRFGATVSLSAHPADALAFPGQPAAFAVQVTGNALPSFQWQIETAPDVWTDLSIYATALPCGGSAVASMPDASATDITVTGCAQTQRIRCLLLRSCGTVVSQTALLRLCPADFNADGAADFFDYLDFVAAFDTEAPAADFNGDSAVDFFDYLDFVAAFDQGC